MDRYKMESLDRKLNRLVNHYSVTDKEPCLPAIVPKVIETRISPRVIRRRKISDQQ